MLTALNSRSAGDLGGVLLSGYEQRLTQATSVRDLKLLVLPVFEALTLLVYEA
jgi:hypothetical protein